MKTFLKSERPPSTSLSLLQRAQRNESEAWQMLVDLYAPVVYTRCRLQWKLSAADAENVGQDVFAAVARKLQDFQRQRSGSFRTWLRTITDNKCKDLLAKQPFATAAGGSGGRAVIENVSEPSIENESNATLSEKALVMRQALKAVENEFSQRDLAIFWRIAVEDANRQDLAGELQVSDNVVYLAFSRIRKRLSEIFQELLDEND